MHPEDRLIVFNLGYDYIHSLTMIISIPSLLAILRDRVELVPARAVPIKMHWLDWGQASARVLVMPPSHQTWIGYVSGSRFVRTRQSGHEARTQFELLDFNPTRVRRALQDSANKDPTENWTVINEPSVIPLVDYHVFSEEVETSLPFILSWSAPEIELDLLAVMIDDDNIVLVRRGEEQFEVLTF